MFQQELSQDYDTLARKKKSYLFPTFALALLLGALIYLPFVLQDNGYFVLYGDFNVQQIPFYQLAHKAVRNGDIFWNWYTDLGVNFIGSYSFYLLFSPFFWLTLPFPNSWLPFLMAPLLVLKTACAAVTVYLYLRIFVKDNRNALLGGLLYAFSGWMTFNVFFNHFHDVAVFFPLLLLSLEKLVTENKKIFFALMVALNAMVNYWFFVGEVVFVIIYVIVRGTSKDWNMSWNKFGRIAFESVLGLALAAFAVMPSVLAIMGNPRAGTDRLLNGWGFWSYWQNSSANGDYPQRLQAIIHSIIFPPDLTARPNFFPLHGAQWASLSAWLPLFSVSGVIGYFTQNRGEKKWLTKLLALCLFFALIPGFNSLFVLLNNSYYARWFYMPVLLMSLATILAFENISTDPKSIEIGLKWTAIASGLIIIACCLTPNLVDGQWQIGLAHDIPMAWIWSAFLVVGLIVVFVLVRYFYNSPHFFRFLIISSSVMIVTFGITYFFSGRAVYSRSNQVISIALGNKGKFELDDDFARADIYDDMDNMLMFWELPNIQAFHSIVPPSIMEFYPEVGVERNEASRPDTEYYALRSLLSVRWLFIEESKEEQSPMPYYQLWDNQNGYNIYENEGCIPMGFGYNYYVTREQLDNSNLTDREKGNLMIKAMVIDEQHSSYLRPLPENQWGDLSEESYIKDTSNRKQQIVDDFQITQHGFTSTTSFEKGQTVFFSVPYDKGWTAHITSLDDDSSGTQPLTIQKANIGFMAVNVPAGNCQITFEYQTPGLWLGINISLAALALTILLSIIEAIMSRRRLRPKY